MIQIERNQLTCTNLFEKFQNENNYFTSGHLPLSIRKLTHTTNWSIFFAMLNCEERNKKLNKSIEWKTFQKDRKMKMKTERWKSELKLCKCMWISWLPLWQYRINTIETRLKTKANKSKKLPLIFHHISFDCSQNICIWPFTLVLDFCFRVVFSLCLHHWSLTWLNSVVEFIQSNLRSEKKKNASPSINHTLNDLISKPDSYRIIDNGKWIIIILLPTFGNESLVWTWQYDWIFYETGKNQISKQLSS